MRFENPFVPVPFHKSVQEKEQNIDLDNDVESADLMIRLFRQKIGKDYRATLGILMPLP